MRNTSRLLKVISSLWLALMLVLALSAVSPSSAQDHAEEEAEAEEVDPAVEAENNLIREGSAVYAATCQSCHQPGGAGLEGSFPPLKGNSNVSDTDYVRGVVTDGLSGPLEANGVSYDGVMPSFSTLSDDDIDAVVAFIAADLVIPASAAGDAVIADVADAGGTLPGLSVVTYLLAFVAFLLLLVGVNAPRLISVNDRLDTEWFDVGLKTITIVISVILLTVFIPNWAVQSSTVAKMPRFALDAIGTGLWSVGLGAVLGGLWWAHKESRI